MVGPQSSRADVDAAAASIDQQNTPKCTTKTLLSPRRLLESPAFSTRSKKTINVDVSTLSTNLEARNTPKKRRTLGRTSESSVAESEDVTVSSKAERGPDVANSQANTGPAMGSMLNKISGLSSNEASSGEEGISEKEEPAAATPTKRALFTLKTPTPVSRRSLRSASGVTAVGSQDSKASSQQTSSPAKMSPAKQDSQEPVRAPDNEGVEEGTSADESDSSTVKRFTRGTARGTQKITRIEETEESSSEVEDEQPHSVVRRRSQATNTMPCIVESENEESQESSDEEHVPAAGSKVARIESSEEEVVEEEDRCADQEQNGEDDNPFFDVTEILKDDEESDGEMADKENSDLEEELTKEIQKTIQLDESSQKECESESGKEKVDDTKKNSQESAENSSDVVLEINEQKENVTKEVQAAPVKDSKESDKKENLKELKETENKENNPTVKATKFTEYDSDVSTELYIDEVQKLPSDSDSSVELIPRQKEQDTVTRPNNKITPTKSPSNQVPDQEYKLLNCVVALKDVVKSSPLKLELKKELSEGTKSTEKTPTKTRESPLKHQIEGAKLQGTPSKKVTKPVKVPQSPFEKIEAMKLQKLQDAILEKVTKESPMKEKAELQKSPLKKDATPVKMRNSPFKDFIDISKSQDTSLTTPVKVSALKDTLHALLPQKATTPVKNKNSPIKSQGTPLKKTATPEKTKNIVNRETLEIIQLGPSPRVTSEPINKTSITAASKSPEKTKISSINALKTQESRESKTVKKKSKNKETIKRQVGDKPQTIPKPVESQSIDEEVLICNGGSSNKKQASFIMKSQEKTTEQNTSVQNTKKNLLGSLFQQAALFNEPDSKTERKSKKRKSKEFRNSTKAKIAKTSFLGSAVEDKELSEDEMGDSWQRVSSKTPKESHAQRQRRLQMQLKAMRNWQVTELPETTAEKSDSDNEIQQEPKESTKKRKKKRTKLRQEEPSVAVEAKPRDVPQAAMDYDSDAPQEVSFSAAKVSAFAALQEAARSIQQEREKKRERQRARQEQHKVEREAKEQREKKKLKAQAKTNRKVQGKAELETSAVSAVPAKLPLSVLHQLSERPTIHVALPKPAVTPVKPVPEKKSLKSIMEKKSEELQSPESGKKKKRHKKKKKKTAEAEETKQDCKPEEPLNYMPLQSSGPTQFGVTALDVLQPTSHHKYANWRDRNLYGDRVKRQPMSEAKKVKERLKWRSPGAAKLSGFLPYKP